MWLSKPNSTQAADTDYLFLAILWLCIVSFIVLMGAMFYFIIKYRRRPGVPTIRSPAHNTALELGWSIGPLLLLVPVFFWGMSGYIKKQASPSSVEIIQVRGAQWYWDVTYSNGAKPRLRAKSPSGDGLVPIIIVPLNRPVKLIFASIDVLHAFFIPDFRTKIDVIPNRYTSMWFQPLALTPVMTDASGNPMKDEKGNLLYKDHHVFCAEYCGNNHSDMSAYIRVVSDADYESLKAEYAEPDEKLKPWERGQELWQQYCKSCHTIDGSANTGPTWKNLYGKTEEFSNNPPMDLSDDLAFYNYVRESVYSPQVKIVKGFDPKMNSFQGIIKEKFLIDIVAFIKSPAVSPDHPSNRNPKPAADPAAATPPAEKPADGAGGEKKPDAEKK